MQAARQCSSPLLPLPPSSSFSPTPNPLPHQPWHEGGGSGYESASIACPYCSLPSPSPLNATNTMAIVAIGAPVANPVAHAKCWADRTIHDGAASSLGTRLDSQVNPSQVRCFRFLVEGKGKEEGKWKEGVGRGEGEGEERGGRGEKERKFLYVQFCGQSWAVAGNRNHH
ncbi:unnamed protein product [Closterium sp. NIES-54]